MADLSKLLNGTSAPGTKRYLLSVRDPLPDTSLPPRSTYPLNRFAPVWRAARWTTPIFLVGLFTGGAALFRPDLAVIKDVRFAGNIRATPASLRHLADLPNGTSRWFVDTDSVASAVARHPWVRQADVSLDWRGVVNVDVKEYEPAALVRYGEGLYYTDELGSLFLRARSNDLDYPILTGLDAPALSAHPDLPKLAIRDGLWLLRTLSERDIVPQSDIAGLHFSSTTGFRVQLDGARLEFGLEDLPGRVDRLVTLLARGVDLESPIVVDLGPSRSAVVTRLEQTLNEG